MDVTGSDKSALYLNNHVQIPKNIFLSLALVIFGYNIFVYGAGFGIGAGLFHIILTAAIFISVPGNRRNTVSYLLAFISCISALLVGFRANGFVQWFDMTIAYISVLGLFIYSAYPEVYWKIWPLFTNIVRFIFWSFFQWLLLLGSFASQAARGNKVVDNASMSLRKTVAILKTVFIAVVVLYFFAFLLSAADPIFAKIIDRILSESFGRIVGSLFIASTVGILLTISLRPSDEKDPRLWFLSAQDILVTSAGLIFLFGSFLSVQFRYLFASHEVFQSFGLTYSQYVRKGFFELLIAAAIGLGISYIILLKRRTDPAHASYLRGIIVTLLTALFLLLLSAYRRDLMYIEVYGLTRARIVGEVFLYWLSGGILLLFIHNLWSVFKEKYIVGGIGLITVGILIYLNFINMDMRIVKAAPIRNDQKDIFYIANLSEDAFKSWSDVIAFSNARLETFLNKTELNNEEKNQLAVIKLSAFALQDKREKLEKSYGPIDSVNEKVKAVKEGMIRHDRFGHIIHGTYSTKPFERERAWQAFNWSEYLAWKNIERNKDLYFTDLDLVVSRVSEIQHTKKLNLYETERWILYDFKYPFITIVSDNLPYIDYSQPSPSPSPSPSVVPSVIKV